jgi:hypothetical protein
MVGRGFRDSYREFQILQDCLEARRFWTFIRDSRVVGCFGTLDLGFVPIRIKLVFKGLRTIPVEPSWTVRLLQPRF